MGNETIVFEHLGIEIPCPETVTVYNEGYTSKYDFMNRCSYARIGRAVIHKDNDPMEHGAFLCACRTNELDKKDKKFKNIHIYVDNRLEEMVPLGFYAWGNVETHALIETVADGEIILKKKMSLSLQGDLKFSLLNRYQKANVGGLYCLHECGIKIGERSDSDWAKFLKQCHPYGIIPAQDFKVALGFSRENLNDTSRKN